MFLEKEQALLKRRHVLQGMLRGVLRGRIARPGRPWWTYFIQGEKTQLIKIGKAVDTHRRCSDLQTGSPDKLMVLLAIRGDFEKRLHRKFSAERSHGEWFYPEKVLTYLQEIAPSNQQLEK